MATLLEFTNAPGSWEAHYWTANQTLAADGHYVEYIVTELVNGVGYGISTVSTGVLTNTYVFWYSSGAYILLNGSVNASYLSRTINLFDRIRFRKSGSSVIVSHNGEDFHTISLSGTLYAYAGSFNGTASVNVDSVNGSAVTTLNSAAVTVTAGVPSTDYFASNAALFYTPLTWVGTGRSKASSQPGAALRFNFTGSTAGIIFDASSQVNMTDDIKTRIAYRIDGGDWTYHTLLTPTRRYREIASGLSSGTHTAEVLISYSFLGTRFGASNRYAELVSYGVRLPTTSTLSAADTRPLLVVGYTDSNGEGAEGLAGANAQPIAYTQLIADGIFANLALQSVPGQGWITTPGGTPTLQTGWDLYPSGDSKLTAGALVPEPDIIFICHGQNDASSVTSAATATINEMLAATTDTLIVVMCPVGRHRRSELQAAVAAVNNARVSFFDNHTDWLADYSEGGLNTHLTQSGQALAASVYIPQFAKLIGDTVLNAIDGLVDDVADLQTLIRQSNVATEVDTSTIKLNVASTKAKTHLVSSNLTGKTLKLYIETAPGVFFAERDATGADGSFSFTPSSALVANIRTFSAALREPSDGNNVLWKGSIEVAYAADAE